ncbi:hypothetical protein NDU88_004885 [Pleurodeles waltl]|uniref:Secreted protein n=1 Tax=Pleurodeles waltl TaxID=8319 RepID=A0AAV7VM04_PLEWA|nr:hypothetical protein NDU88_004885 [Pleurodeles waltl]
MQQSPSPLVSLLALLLSCSQKISGCFTSYRVICIFDLLGVVGAFRLRVQHGLPKSVPRQARVTAGSPRGPVAAPQGVHQPQVSLPAMRVRSPARLAHHPLLSPSPARVDCRPKSLLTLSPKVFGVPDGFRLHCLLQGLPAQPFWSRMPSCAPRSPPDAWPVQPQS